MKTYIIEFDYIKWNFAVIKAENYEKALEILRKRLDIDEARFVNSVTVLEDYLETDDLYLS